MTAIVSISAIVWPFLIYWLVFFVACYAACEVGQDFFYDEVTPNVGLRSVAGSLILAALATWLRPSFDTMFTANIAWTVLQAIVWFGVFIFIFEFHPWHALALEPGDHGAGLRAGDDGRRQPDQVDPEARPRAVAAEQRAGPQVAQLRRAPSAGTGARAAGRRLRHA